MRRWMPASLYEAKPWVLIGIGLLLLLGMMAWSLYAGSWTVWRSLAALAGTAMLIAGGALMQLRQEYRTRLRSRRGNSR